MSKIALIDLSGIFRRYWHAAEQEEVNHARRRTVNDIQRYAEGFDHVAVCIDMPPYKRKEIDPEYKANRDKAPEVLIEEMRLAIEEIDNDGWHVLGAKGYEADDIIAQCVEWVVLNKHMATIFSADKDLLQLVNASVDVVSTATGKRWDSDGVIDAWGVPPDMVADMLAIIGDKSDNVQGLKGIGPKTAAKWLQAGNLDWLLCASSDMLAEEGFAQKHVSLIDENREQLGTAMRLVLPMTDAPIDPAIILTEKARKEPEPGSEVDMDGANEMTGEIVEPEVLTPEVNRVAQEPPPQTTAIATTDDQWGRSLEPRDPGQAYNFAKLMHQSKIFGGFPNPEAILAVVMTGRSLGMDAVASLRGFHVVKGKACPSAQVLVGLAKSSPLCEYFQLTESTETQASWETKRKGDPKPTAMSYNIKEAQAAQLIGNDNWKKRPKTMLRWRCATELLRVVYPDIASGIYSVEEMEDSQ